jgi:hypothetical protein
MELSRELLKNPIARIDLNSGADSLPAKAAKIPLNAQTSRRRPRP